MEHLFSIWPEIAGRLYNARQVLLFSDYDGTLTPIVERPELAVLPGGTRQVLQSLLLQRRITLGIISGRALPDLRDKVDIDGAIYSGNHGFEIEGPGLSFINPLAEEVRPFFQTLSQLLATALKPIPGIHIENKGFSLSVHYRQVAERHTGHLNSIFQRVMSEYQPASKFRVSAGKKVIELRPALDWDKGRTIKHLIERYADRSNLESSWLPIYLGDDITDEDGFKAVGEYPNGMGILIGYRWQPTAAQYYLESPDEVSQFLGMLLSFSEQRFKSNNEAPEF